MKYITFEILKDRTRNQSGFLSFDSIILNCSEHKTLSSELAIIMYRPQLLHSLSNHLIHSFIHLHLNHSLQLTFGQLFHRIQVDVQAARHFFSCYTTWPLHRRFVLSNRESPQIVKIRACTVIGLQAYIMTIVTIFKLMLNRELNCMVLTTYSNLPVKEHPNND